MVFSLYLNAAMVDPTAATILIGIALVFLILIVIGARCSFTSKVLTPPKLFNPSASPCQMRNEVLEERKKHAQQCFDMTVELLKKAVIKKTYNEMQLLQKVKTIYTIPLNAKEAAMYLWARVITSAEKNERERVIRMASHIFRIFDDNKEKHVLELEAQAVAAAKLYGGIKGADLLQVRAVDNIDMVKKNQYSSSVMLNPALEYLKPTPDMLVAENVEFLWPQKVSAAAKKLKELSLLAISQDDLNDFSMFPCIKCRQSCSLSELKDLKCPKCRKN
ncbi:MAG: hypothetical protein IJZ68_03090 [Bacteroidaceae bacterium]|nr:hypothetical protein [Bacteroidaceae bacterium]